MLVLLNKVTIMVIIMPRLIFH